MQIRNIGELARIVKGTDRPLDIVRQVFQTSRARWLDSIAPDQKRIVLAKYKRIHGRDLTVTVDEGSSFIDNWANPLTHEKFRIHKTSRDPNNGLAFEIFSALYKQIFSVQSVPDLPLSIVPISLLDNPKYCLPTESPTKPDPFGLFLRSHLITVVLNGREYYVATQKKGYDTALVHFGFGSKMPCLAGCAGCYKFEFTRQGKPIYAQEADGKITQLSFLPAEEQARHLNQAIETRKIRDVLLSGGEPLQLGWNKLRLVLESIAQSTNLNSIRICSGYFLGRPFMLDDSLLAYFQSLKKARHFSLALHIPNLGTFGPETIYEASRLDNSGIKMKAQTPLIEGVNIFIPEGEVTPKSYRENLEQSHSYMDRFMQALTVLNIEPYKWLIDTEGKTPLYFAAALFEFWRSHHGQSDITRPTSLAVFHPEINIDLSLPVLLNAECKSIGNRVYWKLPQGGKTYTYTEPVFPGINYPVDKARDFHQNLLKV